MRYIIIVLAALSFLLPSCEEQKVGFLVTEYALYTPDTLLIAKEIDDENRIKFNIPWVSLPIEGIEGTAPILFSINDVKSNGNVDMEQFLSDVDVRGNGIFEVSLNHKIPSGRYLISLKVKNEGYTKLIPDVFTIIIE